MAFLKVRSFKMKETAFKFKFNAIFLKGIILAIKYYIKHNSIIKYNSVIKSNKEFLIAIYYTTIFSDISK